MTQNLPTFTEVAAGANRCFDRAYAALGDAGDWLRSDLALGTELTDEQAELKQAMYAAIKAAKAAIIDGKNGRMPGEQVDDDDDEQDTSAPEPIVIPRGGLGAFLKEQSAARADVYLADLLRKASHARTLTAGEAWPGWSTGEELAVAYIVEDWDRISGMDFTADDVLSRVYHDLGMDDADQAREALERLRSQL